jgi:UDP-GlcNAc:undecaprenyl-phosphate GlcNAc-1-phosphate transferase
VHTSTKEEAPLELTWTQNGFTSQDYACRQCLLKVELPLLSGDEHSVGSLLLVKDLKRSSLGHYTLRRVEHLRRSIMRGLEKLSRE